MAVPDLGQSFPRTLRLLGASGRVRTETVDGRDYVVVPVVSMVGDSVIHAVNSKFPELVPTDELSIDGWDGRACCADHPFDGTTQVPVNHPGMSERFAFGLVKHTAIVDKRLTMEAYLDPLRASSIGSHASEIVERAKRGEPIEVSVGVHTNLEPTEGVTASGVRYAGIWRRIRPDHLALMTAGKQGACSLQMGCGANRAAESYSTVKVFRDGQFHEAHQTPEVQRMANDAPNSATKKSLKDRLFAFIAAMAPMSDTALRTELEEELLETVPGFAYVHAVYPMEMQVVYCTTAPLSYGMYPSAADPKFWRSSFTMDGEDVTITGEPELVERAPEEFVAAQAWVDAKLKTLGGPNSGARPDAPHPNVGDKVKVRGNGEKMPHGTVGTVVAAHPNGVAVDHGDGNMGIYHPSKLAAASASCGCGDHSGATMDKQKMIEAIIADTKNTFTANDQKFLEGASDGQLKTLMSVESLKAAESKSDDAPKTLGAAEVQAIADKAVADYKAATANQTEDEYLATAPASVRLMVAEKKAADLAKHTALVDSLKTAQSVFTEVDLKAKSIDELTKLAALANVPKIDYSGLGTPRAAQAETRDFTPPDPYAADLAALKTGRVN